jgi:hypothetical protein
MLPSGAILKVLMIGIVGLVILTLFGIVFSHSKEMGNIVFRGTLQGKPGKGLIQIAEPLAELKDNLHRHRAVILYKLAVLIPLNRNKGHIGQGLGGFNMAVGRHGGNDGEKIPRAQDIAPLLLYYLDFLGEPHLALADNKKTVRILLAFDNNIRSLLKINERKL